MTISKERYCSEVCGGKCCYLHKSRPIRCPNLTDDCRCSIYKERFYEGAPPLVQVGKYRHRGVMKPFNCGMIEYILKAGLMPEEMKAGCCYAHPELLQRED